MDTGRRYRVNVSTTSKGQKSYDCTVELVDSTKDNDFIRNQVLLESDALVAELDKRYPPPLEKEDK